MAGPRQSAWGQKVESQGHAVYIHYQIRCRRAPICRSMTAYRFLVEQDIGRHRLMLALLLTVFTSHRSPMFIFFLSSDLWYCSANSAALMRRRQTHFVFFRARIVETRLICNHSIHNRSMSPKKIVSTVTRYHVRPILWVTWSLSCSTTEDDQVLALRYVTFSWFCWWHFYSGSYGSVPLLH